MTDIGNNTTNNPDEIMETVISEKETTNMLEKYVNVLNNEQNKESSDENTDNDTSYSDDDDDVDDDKISISPLINSLSFTENSDLYVVSIDGLPTFYVKDIKTANEKMWDITRQLANKRFLGGYNTNFLKISENELHLIGSFRFFIIAYDTTLHRITYSKVKECV